MNWKKFKEEKPPEGEEVLAYHPSWIDEDFNPRGIRIGFGMEGTILNRLIGGIIKIVISQSLIVIVMIILFSVIE